MSDRFAATLRQLMEASGISGAALGRMLNGTDKSQVSRWRSGQDRPEPATIVKIAEFFGVDPISMLQLADVLPGEPTPIDPRRASLAMIVRQDVPEEDLGTVERFLLTFRPQAAQGANTRRRDGASTQRSAGRRVLNPSGQNEGETDDQGAVPTVYAPRHRTAAHFMNAFKRLVWVPIHPQWPVLQPAR